jgi:chitinase
VSSPSIPLSTQPVVLRSRALTRIPFFSCSSDTEYTTCNGLLWKSSNVFPKSSVFEINSVAGVPLNKIVIGKPSAAYQATNGWVDFQTLAGCITQAGNSGWDAGTMLWEYETSLTSISALVQALAAISGNGGGVPVVSTSISTSSTPTMTPTSTKNKPHDTPTTSLTTTTSTLTSTSSEEHRPTPSTTTTTTSSAAGPTSSSPGGGTDPGCSGAQPWDPNAVYSGGSEVNTPTYVTYNGCLWANKWWTQGDVPNSADDWNPWSNIKSCSSSKRDFTAAQRRSHKKMRRALLSLINDLS